jgi:hypothetical protein
MLFSAACATETNPVICRCTTCAGSIPPSCPNIRWVRSTGG